MSTALLQHQRSHMIAAAAAVLAVAAVGVTLEVSRDSGPGSSDTPQTNTSGAHFKLTGGTHEEGSWRPAGTTSGGHTPLDS
jgi:3-deoxy-D-arabino-heptulosonate 7-phosphate (DAHP) synthase